MDVMITMNQTSAERANLAQATFTTDNTRVFVTLGFCPRVVTLIDATQAVVYTKTLSMGAANTLVEGADGAKSVSTSSAIVITDNGFEVSAVVAGNARAMHFIAQT